MMRMIWWKTGLMPVDHLPFTGAVWSEVRNRKRLRTDLVLEEHIGLHHSLPVEGEGHDEAHSDDCSSA